MPDFYLIEDNEVIMSARILWMGECNMIVRYAWIDDETDKLCIRIDVRPIAWGVWGKRP